MSFYLKYRPNNFESIVGQEQVKDILKAEIEKGKTNSSYIFFGPRGTGKTSTARIFAKAINCVSDKDKPCNKCENCNLINNGKTLDFVEIDAASNTQVEKIREEIIDKAIYPPTILKKKIYIIDEVHMLSKSAFNVLLKIMEEAPEYLVFILATTEVNKIPETIISRCEVFNFQKINKENIIKRLVYICEQEGLDYQEGGLQLIAKIADGALRDAIKYLEQVSIIGNINTENVTKFLGIVPEKQIVDFLETIGSNNIDKIFLKIEQFQKEGTDLGNFVKDILLYLDENLSKNFENNLKLVNLFDKIYANIKNFPTSSLAFKTIIGIELTKENGNLKENLDLIKNKKQKNNENLENENKNKNKEDEQKDKEQNKNITKELLLQNTEEFPVIKGIIKNFGNVQYNNDNLEIIIISKTNYEILNKKDNIKILSKIIEKLAIGIKFEIKYITKEDYLNNKLKK